MAARSENASDSRAGRPNSFTSRAPETPNRSVIVAVMSALSVMRRRERAASRLARRRSRSTKIGITSSDRSVTFHDRASMAASVNTSVKRSDATLAVAPTVCWAPSTSLDSRDMSEPVWVRVKKPIGIRWTWSKRATRRS